jgi:hypothetical protein
MRYTGVPRCDYSAAVAFLLPHAMSLPAFIVRLGGLLAATVSLLATAAAVLGSQQAQATDAAPADAPIAAAAPAPAR